MALKPLATYRIQQTGKRGFVVTLPARWLRERDLQPGDLVITHESQSHASRPADLLVLSFRKEKTP